MFATTDLDFAVFLATGKLKFAGCRMVAENLVEYLFDDPHSQAPQLERAFYGGAEASACAVLDALRRLRRATKRELLRNGGAANVNH